MTHADAYGLAVFADTPVAWYRLDETSGTSAADEMGGAAGTHTAGVIVNQSALPPLGFGKSAQYASGFGGVTTTNTLGSVGLNLLTSSYEFWFKGGVVTGPQAVFGTVNTGGSMIAGCWTNSLNEANSAGKTEFMFRGNGANFIRGTISANIYDGAAHHVVCTVASSTTFNVYVDGTAQTVTYNNQVAMGAAINFEFPMTIGARNLRSVIDRFLDGTVDEVAFYNTTLSPARVAAHYAAAQVPAGPASGTVGRKYIDQPGVYGAGRRR